MLIIPSLALAAYKPARVLFPQINGLACEKENICIEDLEDAQKAYNLANDAESIVSNVLGDLKFKPKFIFCSTQSCFESFGFSKASAINVGKFGTVVSPRGWSQNIIVHELIHQWQNQQYGIFAVLFGEEWMVEGMAYALSNDPREKLAEPWQSYRQRFNEWFSTVDKKRLVKAIEDEL